MNIKEIQDVLMEMYDYLREVDDQEYLFYEGYLHWGTIEEFYTRLYKLGLLTLNEKEN